MVLAVAQNAETGPLDERLVPIVGAQQHHHRVLRRRTHTRVQVLLDLVQAEEGDTQAAPVHEVAEAAAHGVVEEANGDGAVGWKGAGVGATCARVPNEALVRHGPALLVQANEVAEVIGYSLLSSGAQTKHDARPIGLVEHSNLPVVVIAIPLEWLAREAGARPIGASWMEADT